MTRILMHGYRGKMGKVILDLIAKDDLCDIAAGIDTTPSESTVPYPTFTNIFDCDMQGDVIIDFSVAHAVKPLLDYAVSKNTPLVLCTTGLSDNDLIEIKKASEQIAIFKSANMSLGVNLIAGILKKVSKTLYDEGFDIEIVEKHHNKKVDAPSGTALLLAEYINSEMEPKLNSNLNRSAVLAPRERTELGIHSIRGGSIVGEHSVIFAGQDEVIEFNHLALSKEVFAVGALKAAKFLAGKPAGLYNMENIMPKM